MGVGAVVRAGVGGFGGVEPAVLLPHGGKEVIVPAENVGRCVGIGGVEGLRERIVVAEGGIDGSVVHVRFEGLVRDFLFVFHV